MTSDSSASFITGTIRSAILFMLRYEPWSRNGGSVRVVSVCAADAMYAAFTARTVSRAVSRWRSTATIRSTSAGVYGCSGRSVRAEPSPEASRTNRARSARERPASGASTGLAVSAFSTKLSAKTSSRPLSTSPRFHTSARLASMSGIRNRSPDSVYGLPAMHTANRLPRRSWLRGSPSRTPSIRRVASQSGMNFWSSSGEVCWMSSR